MNPGKLSWLSGLRPQDPASAEGRSRERYRRVFLSGAGAIFNNGLAFALSLVAVPLTLQHLGTERYGLWVTVASLAAMLGIGDLGIGSGLVTALSAAHGRDDHREQHALISTAFAILLGLSCALGLSYLIALPFIPFARLLDAPESLAGEARLASSLLVAVFLIGLPLGLSLRVQAAYQEGLAASYSAMAAAAVSFALLVVAIRLHASLPFIALALGCIPTLSGAFAAVQVLRMRKPWLLPDFRKVERAAARRLLTFGSSFVLMQAAGTIAFTSDSLILAHLLGPSAVATYSVAARVFSVVAIPVQLALLPLWPAYAEALARGDLRWARTALRRTIRLSLGFASLASLMLAIAGGALIRVWVGGSVQPTAGLLVALAAWTVTAALGNCISMFLNGAGWLTSQAVVALITAGVALLGKLWLTRALGVAGVVWATEIAYLLFSLIPWSLMLPRVLGRVERVPLSAKAS